MADNEQKQGKTPATAATVRARAEGAIKEARVKSFEGKLKPELEKLIACEDALEAQKQKVEQMMVEFDEANKA